jgi:para-nitrobenzyl esterase
MARESCATSPLTALRRRLSRHRRALGAVVAAVVALAVLSGCTIDRPAGPSPLRYRDQVFSNVSVTRDIQYGSAPDSSGNPVALKLDLYQPSGDTQTNRPAVVWVHGGGFSGGDKGSGPSADLANIFAKLGYVTVSINYRLISTPCGGSNLGGACTTAAINAQHDAEAAVRWLRKNAAGYGIDPTRIGIGGESAGAITAALAGTHSEDPGDSGNPGYPSNVGGFVSISGGLPNGVFASAGDAPGVLFHGTADPVVPYQWSVDLSLALLRVGVAGILEPLEGAGHVPYAQYHDLFAQQSDYFFYDFMDLAHAQGQPVAAARAFDRQLPALRKKYPRLSNQLTQMKKKYRQFTK